MSSMQLIFLFDLNAYNDLNLRTGSNLSKNLLSLRLACLRLLTEFSTKYAQLKWGFKFFDSCGSLTQVMNKFSFPNFSLESFEVLENEICVRYERHLSYFEALTESVHKNQSLYKTCKKNTDSQADNQKDIPLKLLQLALTQILCEYQWDSNDLWSPNAGYKAGSSKNSVEKENYLFFITKCPDYEEDFFKYYGVEYATLKSSKFINLLLSQSLRGQLLEKFDIRWIWLNTSQKESFLSSSCGITAMISSSLHSVQGSLIPLCVFSQSHYVSKLMCSVQKQVHLMGQDSELFEEPVCKNIHNNSLLPFSVLLNQSLSYPFYSNTYFSSECFICFYNTDETIPVSVMRINSDRCLFRADEFSSKKACQTKRKTDILNNKNNNAASIWSKFVIQCTVSRTIKEAAYDVLLCLPNASVNSSVYVNFKQLIKVLFLENVNLVVKCESKHGIQMPGLLSPLTDVSAVISILDPAMIQCVNKQNLEFSSSVPPDEEIGFKEKIKEEIQDFKLKSNETSNYLSNEAFDLYLRPFQMECMETWFEPTSSVSSLICNLKAEQTSASKMEAFHELLKSTANVHRHVKVKKAIADSSDNVERDTEYRSTLTEHKSNIDGANTKSEILENYSNVTDEELQSMLSNMYDFALDSSNCLVETAKKIVKIASDFFQERNNSSYKEDVRNFMKAHILINCGKINEKYDISRDEESANKKIRECQMQAILILELEALSPSPEKSDCVVSVTSFLRTMSFYSGASELNKLLYETLRENYSHNLYSVLLEIGDELDIPIVGEIESSDSSNENPSSELTNESDFLSSVVSSTLSGKSCSSVCSKRDNRKLMRHRSDISDTSKSRQVLLPGTSNKRKKAKCDVSKKATRCSPRLASKKKQEKSKIRNENPHNVCRNLFPQDGIARTPKKNKTKGSLHKGNKILSTPKCSKILKANFVAETPSHKQNCSALQRRKSLVESTGNSLNEIAESPTVLKTAKDAANLNLLHKLRKNISSPVGSRSDMDKAKMSNNMKPFEYTPESKRRLSLKLFSKLLTSPTARMGLKKCSKRLFSQTSPQSYEKSSKKLKSCEEP